MSEMRRSVRFITDKDSQAGKNAKVINRDPAMFVLTQEYLREMSKYFEHFCYFAHVGQAGNGGAWGAIEFTGQPIADAPNYRALLEWAKNTSPAKALLAEPH